MGATKRVEPNSNGAAKTDLHPHLLEDLMEAITVNEKLQVQNPHLMNKRGDWQQSIALKKKKISSHRNKRDFITKTSSKDQVGILKHN